MTRRRRRRRRDPVRDTVFSLEAGAARQPCTCQPGRRRHPEVCTACVAWGKGRVLLTSGQQAPRAVWMQRYEVPREEVQP